MSEKINHRQEEEEEERTSENLTSPAETTSNKEKSIESQPRHSAEKAPDIEKIKHEVAKRAKSSEEISKAHQEQETEDEPIDQSRNIGSQLQTQALKQTLKKARTHLPKSQRVFSKFIHNDKVDKLSDATAATIGRPSGVLFGGVCSFVVSLLVLILSYYLGYEYNYLIGIAGFAGGFILGIILEMALKVVRKS